jgi:hypothetical protein
MKTSPEQDQLMLVFLQLIVTFVENRKKQPLILVS